MQDQTGGGRLAAVTGITGFIGGHLAAELTRRGWRLRVLARSMPRFTSLTGAAVEVVPGDLSDDAALRVLTTGVDAVVHLAGAIKGRGRADFMRDNAEGTAALARAWRDRSPEARFVLLSSMAAREPQLSHYAASKHAAEQHLATIGDGMDWRALRPGAVYGPGDRETLRIFRAASWPIQPMLNGPQARLTLVHVADLSQVVAVVLEGGSIGLCHEITDGQAEGYSWDQLVRAAALALGQTARPFRVPSAAIRLAGFLGDAISALGGSPEMLTSQKVREVLHQDWSARAEHRLPSGIWHPRIGLAEGFADAVAWYRAAGMLGS